MCRLKYCITLFVLITSVFYNCNGGGTPSDQLTLIIVSWDTITYVAIETLKVRVNCITNYKDEANYQVYFEGLDLWNQIRFTSFIEEIDNMHYGETYDRKLKWFGLVPSGKYNLRIHFKKITGTTREKSIDSIYAQVGPAALINTSQYTLIRWCGDGRYGNTNETLQAPAAYPIFVRAINPATGIGINGKYVSFSTSAGALTLSDDSTNSITVPYGGEWLDGLAGTNLILSGGVNDYTVTATCGNSSVDFHLMRVFDNEIVPNDTLKIHECWGDTKTSQISGDGYWGTNDLDPTVKNLKLEIDYDMVDKFA